MPRYRRHRIGAEAAGALLMLSPASSAYADAGRGQTLFNQFCSGCHSPRPGDPLRTGSTFTVWSTSAGVPGSSPVCRFYIAPGNGDSHFYSASPQECDDVRNRFPQFTYESPEVMAASLPDLATGECPAATQPVYRLWNMRVDSNHRYAVTLGTRDAMIAKGYVPEGYGPAGVAFCAPL